MVTHTRWNRRRLRPPERDLKAYIKVIDEDLQRTSTRSRTVISPRLDPIARPCRPPRSGHRRSRRRRPDHGVDWPPDHPGGQGWGCEVEIKHDLEGEAPMQHNKITTTSEPRSIDQAGLASFAASVEAGPRTASEPRGLRGTSQSPWQREDIEASKTMRNWSPRQKKGAKFPWPEAEGRHRRQERGRRRPEALRRRYGLRFRTSSARRGEGARDKAGPAVAPPTNRTTT